MNKRNSEILEGQRRTPGLLCNIGAEGAKSTGKPKRRRSSTSKRASKSRSFCLEADKENQFTSTPIKSPEDRCQADVLRDLSNLTPQDATSRRSAKKCGSQSNKKIARRIEEEFSPVASVSRKKKKRCVEPYHYSSPNCSGSRVNSHYFKHFEAVDSHIEGVTLFNPCDCDNNVNNVTRNKISAPTLPQPSSPMKFSVVNHFKSTKLKFDELCPPNKRAKVDHVNDFLQQISALTSPEERLRLPQLNPYESNDKSINISPLVKRLVDLRFSKAAKSDPERVSVSVANDSSYINNLSLDKIVDAILETSSASERLLGENEFNESHEDNLINSAHERNNLADSGYRVSATKHEIDANFSCKCRINNNNTKVCDKTMINLEGTFNERCVDVARNNRKRLSSSFADENHRKKFCPDADEDFNLKRQKCIRRRKCNNQEARDQQQPFLAAAPTNDSFSDNSFDSNEKMNLQETFTIETPSAATITAEHLLNSRRIRRCLLFDSPNYSHESERNSLTSRKHATGSVDLEMYYRNGELFVNGEFGATNMLIK